jgi:hypothetical protein
MRRQIDFLAFVARYGVSNSQISEYLASLLRENVEVFSGVSGHCFQVGYDVVLPDEETEIEDAEVKARKAEIEDQTKEEELSFGTTMDLSKGASPIGKRVKEGLELAFNMEHTLNDVPGIIPKLTVMDDEYTPKGWSPFDLFLQIWAQTLVIDQFRICK